MSSICTHCNGVGGWYTWNGDWVCCDECKGRGLVETSEDLEQEGQLRLW